MNYNEKYLKYPKDYFDLYRKYKKKYLLAKKKIKGGVLHAENPICSGPNIFDKDGNHCSDPEYPCITPTLRCSDIKNEKVNNIINDFKEFNFDLIKLKSKKFKERCSGENIYNPNECSERDYPCVTPNL